MKKIDLCEYLGEEKLHFQHVERNLYNINQHIVLLKEKGMLCTVLMNNTCKVISTI